MTSKAFKIAMALIFLGGVVAYYGMLAWTFGHVRGSYVRGFVLASAVAVAMGRGNQFSLWLAAVLAACGSASAFQLAFYSYPDGTTAHGFIVPGAALSLVSFTILASEAMRLIRKSSHSTDSASFDGLHSSTTSIQKVGLPGLMSGDRFRGKSVIVLAFAGVVLLAGSDQVADLFNRRLSRVDQSTTLFWIWDSSWKEKSTYQLEPEGEKLVASLLKRNPDSVIDSAILLMPSGGLTFEAVEYALEDDQIVLTDKGETRVWHHRGIRNELIEKSKRAEADDQPDRVMDITYRDEKHEVPEGEVWKLTWTSPYETGDIHPAYDVRVSGPCYTTRGLNTEVTKNSSSTVEPGQVDVWAGDTRAEIWIAGDTEFDLANELVKVRIEAYKTVPRK